ncbi:hypothetical protein ACTTAI_19325 [Rhodobacter capsulatus]|uniref:hypothetical protein n=1 Tax=Rhodobacter capsulatus TaxID=1061 RepID=UPI004025CE00
MTFEERKNIMSIVRSLPPETAVLLESLVRWMSIRAEESDLDQQVIFGEPASDILTENELAAAGRVLSLVDKLIDCGAAAKLIALARVMGDDE